MMPSFACMTLCMVMYDCTFVWYYMYIEFVTVPCTCILLMSSFMSSFNVVMLHYCSHANQHNSDLLYMGNINFSNKVISKNGQCQMNIY